MVMTPSGFKEFNVIRRIEGDEEDGVVVSVLEFERVVDVRSSRCCIMRARS